MGDRPEIGLHHDVPEAVYRSWDAVSQGLLGHVCDGRTLAHAREEILHPKDPTPAMIFGSRLHPCILEPERFERQYWARPDGIDKRTIEGKAAWKALEMEHAGKEIIPKEDYDKLLSMRDAAWSNPLVAELLGGTRLTEVCAVWMDAETGLLCKGRIDLLTTFGGWTVVGDLKSTKDASQREFSRACANYGYHRQAAFYLDGLNELDPRERRFYFIAIEKEPPYCAAAYELDYESLELGRRQYRKALETWAEAKETGLWPGYPLEVQTLELPRWAMSTSEEAIL